MTNWMKDAACKDAPIEDFFPEPGHHPNKEHCRACPVQQECLDYANEIEGEWRVGLWGGTTPRQRQRQSGLTLKGTS